MKTLTVTKDGITYEYPENDSFVPYMLENYPKDTVILEIGAGIISTKIFSQHFDKMYSVENNSRFADIYHDNYIKIDLDPTTGWYKADEFAEKLPQDYDVIFLDGPAGGFHLDVRIPREGGLFRLGLCEKNWLHIKKDVDIIVDDIERDWKEREVVEFLRDKGYQCEDHGKFCVCRPG